LVKWLRSQKDCSLEEGLTYQELTAAQDRFRVRFHPIWAAVLATVHPVSLPKPPRDKDGVLRWTRYPDWRGRDLDGTFASIEWPIEGLLFDVEHNGFWWRAWGDRPDPLEDALDLARQKLDGVPRLTPLRGHLYLHDTRDSPVFSIYQADLFVPAVALSDLPDGRSGEGIPVTEYPLGNVPFWSDLHAWAQIGHFTEFGDLAVEGT
jgi:hypothetical protein